MAAGTASSDAGGDGLLGGVRRPRSSPSASPTRGVTVASLQMSPSLSAPPPRPATTQLPPAAASSGVKSSTLNGTSSPASAVDGNGTSTSPAAVRSTSGCPALWPSGTSTLRGAGAGGGVAGAGVAASGVPGPTTMAPTRAVRAVDGGLGVLGSCPLASP